MERTSNTQRMRRSDLGKTPELTFRFVRNCNMWLTSTYTHKSSWCARFERKIVVLGISMIWERVLPRGLMVAQFAFQRFFGESRLGRNTSVLCIIIRISSFVWVMGKVFTTRIV
jgi:hypothetical protein